MTTQTDPNKQLVLSRTDSMASLKKLTADCDYAIAVLKSDLRKVQKMRTESNRVMKIINGYPKARKFTFKIKEKRKSVR